MASHCDFVAGVFAGKCFEFLNLNYNSLLMILIIVGGCSMFLSHPLDTVKTNMQSGNMGFLQASRVLFKTEGVSEFIILNNNKIEKKLYNK